MVKNPLANAGDIRDRFSPWVGKIPWRSILTWRIPWTEEPGRLQSNGVAKSQTQLSAKSS